MHTTQARWRKVVEEQMHEFLATREKEKMKIQETKGDEKGYLYSMQKLDGAPQHTRQEPRTHWARSMKRSPRLSRYSADRNTSETRWNEDKQTTNKQTNSQQQDHGREGRKGGLGQSRVGRNRRKKQVYWTVRGVQRSVRRSHDTDTRKQRQGPNTSHPSQLLRCLNSISCDMYYCVKGPYLLFL